MPAIRSAAINSRRKSSSKSSKNLFAKEETHASEEDRLAAMKAAKELAILETIEARSVKSEDLAVFPGHARLNYVTMTLRDNRWFQLCIIMVIFAAAILVGIQTDAEFATEHKAR